MKEDLEELRRYRFLRDRLQPADGRQRASARPQPSAGTPAAARSGQAGWQSFAIPQGGPLVARRDSARAAPGAAQGPFLPANAVHAVPAAGEPRAVRSSAAALAAPIDVEDSGDAKTVEAGGKQRKSARREALMLPLTRRIRTAMGVSAVAVSAMVFSAGTFFGLSLQLREAPAGGVAILAPLGVEAGGGIGAQITGAAEQLSGWTAAAAAGFSTLFLNDEQAEAALPAAGGIAVPPRAENALAAVSTPQPAEPRVELDSLLPVDSLLANAPPRPATASLPEPPVARVGFPLNDEQVAAEALTPTQFDFAVLESPVGLEGPVQALHPAPSGTASAEAASAAGDPPPLPAMKPAPLVAGATPVQPAATAAQGYYMVQLGAFRDLNNARDLARQAEGLDLGTVVLQPLDESRGGSLHAVRLAGFANLDAARIAQRSLDARGFGTGMVVRAPN